MGVPQRSIPSPLLLSLYINDPLSVCHGVNEQIYADDTIIYIHGKSVEEVVNKLTSVMEK